MATPRPSRSPESGGVGTSPPDPSSPMGAVPTNPDTRDPYTPTHDRCVPRNWCYSTFPLCRGVKTVRVKFPSRRGTPDTQNLPLIDLVRPSILSRQPTLPRRSLLPVGSLSGPRTAGGPDPSVSVEDRSGPRVPCPSPVSPTLSRRDKGGGSRGRGDGEGVGTGDDGSGSSPSETRGCSTWSVVGLAPRAPTGGTGTARLTPVGSRYRTVDAVEGGPTRNPSPQKVLLGTSGGSL